MSNSAPDPDKLRALGERLDRVRGREDAAQVESPPSPMGFVLRLSTELVLALFVGAAMGWCLDWLFGRFLFNTRPIFIVIMSLFGAAAGMRNVFRMARKLNARNGPPPPDAPKDDEDD